MQCKMNQTGLTMQQVQLKWGFGGPSRLEGAEGGNTFLPWTAPWVSCPTFCGFVLALQAHIQLQGKFLTTRSWLKRLLKGVVLGTGGGGVAWAWGTEGSSISWHCPDWEFWSSNNGRKVANEIARESPVNLPNMRDICSSNTCAQCCIVS